MRGQTTLDFATGVSVFLLVILFVFTFVPGILTPFTETAQEETVTANRVADLLAKDLVADPGEPYLLDGECTAALMSDSAGPGCGFDGATFTTRLDLGEFQSVNVTMTGSPGQGGDNLLCWNGTTHRVVNTTDSACTASDIVLEAGEETPDSADSVVTARRIVTVGDRVVAMEVKVW